MTRVSEVIRGWLGWCPHAGALHTAPTMRAAAPVAINLPLPDGGGGRSGRLNRGISLAVGSIKILFRNLRLLWFSFLTGLVMIFSLATSLYLQVVSGTDPFPGTDLVANSPEILIAKGSFLWVALTFTIGLISTFLTYYLLAGLILCVSSIFSGQTTTIREGLSRARNHGGSLAGWAVIGALGSTASSVIMNAWTANLPVVFLSMGAVFVFFVLTMFVVPAIVLNAKRILPAIRDSLSVFQRMWGEIIVCLGILFLIVFGIYLAALIPIIFIGFSSGSTASAGFAVILTMLVMSVLMFICSTVIGIATLGIYTCGKTGSLPPAFRGARREELYP